MKKTVVFYFLIFATFLNCKQKTNLEKEENPSIKESALISELEFEAKENLLDKWYPLVLDSVDGG